MGSLPELIIRADAGQDIGEGHLMRCLALAQEWRERGGGVVVVTSCRGGALRQRLMESGCRTVLLASRHPAPDDWRTMASTLRRYPRAWAVCDGIHFDECYRRRIKDANHRLLVVDDTAGLSHYTADIVLNQNIGAEQRPYPCDASTVQLLGVRYVLLRREILCARKALSRVPAQARRVLVTAGGADPFDMTARIIMAIRKASIDGLDLKVVVGSHNPRTRQYQALIAPLGTSARLECSVRDMSALQRWADMAILCGGGTLWECLYLGCPVLSYAINETQARILRALGMQSVIRYGGMAKTQSPGKMVSAIRQLVGDQTQRAEFARRGRKLVDGRGASRIVEQMSRVGLAGAGANAMARPTVWRAACRKMHATGEVSIEPFTRKHLRRTFAWVQDPGLQRDFLMREAPSWDRHVAYFTALWRDQSQKAFAILRDGVHVGNAGLKHVVKNEEAEIWLYIGDRNVRRQGVGISATRLLIACAAERMGLKRLYLHVADFNKAAVGLYRTLGFRAVRSRGPTEWDGRGVKVTRMTLRCRR